MFYLVEVLQAEMASKNLRGYKPCQLAHYYKQSATYFFDYIKSSV